MSWNPFAWIRQQARNAFLGGIADALQDVAPNGDGAPPLTLDQLRDRLSPPALADAEPDKPAKAGKGKVAS